MAVVVVRARGCWGRRGRAERREGGREGKSRIIQAESVPDISDIRLAEFESGRARLSPRRPWQQCGRAPAGPRGRISIQKGPLLGDLSSAPPPPSRLPGEGWGPGGGGGVPKHAVHTGGGLGSLGCHTGYNRKTYLVNEIG